MTSGSSEADRPPVSVSVSVGVAVLPDADSAEPPVSAALSIEGPPDPIVPGGVLPGRGAAFEVHLDNFDGPFDLLLGLISKHKLDVTEIALAKVTDDFVGWIRARGTDWDLDETSEFLVVAATLLDLKAARLLPAAEVEDDEDLALLDLLPANIDLSAAEVQLVSEVAREQVLQRVLRPVLDEYDVVLIDCQPSLGLLTVNALTAAHGVIIPLECEFFALRGVALLVETIEKVRDRINPALEIDGILATMYDPRTLHSREVVARVVEAFGDQVFHTVIGRTVKFPDASVAAEPITTYASSHAGAYAYRLLARELIARGDAA